jgi:hypothetical protein
MKTPRQIRTFWYADAALIAIVISIAIASAHMIADAQPDTVRIYRDNALAAEYPLKQDRVVTVAGENGPMRIHIHDERVEIQTSRCPRQICVLSGAITKPGQQLICAPNHVLVMIHDSEEESLDAISQ